MFDAPSADAWSRATRVGASPSPMPWPPASSSSTTRCRWPRRPPAWRALVVFQSFALDGAPLVQTWSLLGGLNPRPHRWPRSSRRRRAPRTSRTLGSARRLRSKTRWTGPRILRLRILRLPSWSNTQSGQLHVAVAACGESCDGGLCRYRPAQKAVRLLKIDF